MLSDDQPLFREGDRDADECHRPWKWWMKGVRVAKGPVIASGLAGMRSTGILNFITGKQLYDFAKCHLSGAVFDSDWERQAAEILAGHPRV